MKEKTITICDETQVAQMCRQALLTYLPKLVGDELPYIACVEWNEATEIPKNFLPHILIIGPGKNSYRWPIVLHAQSLGINVVVWSSDPVNAEKAGDIGVLFQEKRVGAKALAELLVPFLKQ